MVRFISTKVMPHSGGIVRAHRHWRVVQRRKKIGPDIVDFRGGLVHGLDDVLNMAAVQLSETSLHSFRWQYFTSDPHSGRGAAQHIRHKFHKTFHIIIGVSLL